MVDGFAKGHLILVIAFCPEDMDLAKAEVRIIKQAVWRSSHLRPIPLVGLRQIEPSGTGRAMRQKLSHERARAQGSTGAHRSISQP